MVLVMIMCVDTHKEFKKRITQSTIVTLPSWVGNKLKFLTREEQCSGLLQEARKPSQFSMLRRLALTKARKGDGKTTKYRASNHPLTSQKPHFTKVHHRLWTGCNPLPGNLLSNWTELLLGNAWPQFWGPRLLA